MNKNITKEVQCLPEMFQGLGMFNLNVDGLGVRIHFLKQNWGLNMAAGHLLRHAYKVFQMEVGLDGNIFTRDYDKLEYLSSHSWFKATWALCWRFRVNIRISDENDIPPSHEGATPSRRPFLTTGRSGNIQ